MSFFRYLWPFGKDNEPSFERRVITVIPEGSISGGASRFDGEALAGGSGHTWWDGKTGVKGL